ncbi:hypothetical protein SELR_pSRC500160 (plasmid) [Selenomonas ruminantium subsp. lactilytica TAM6421]|uniref:Uncharacterized protein n=1 Tax=Selenomonas ruminantium subsp. lactilytica (strain NBRC 103574 / TAM6421) TaxID=927704 RepID=I0GWQ3_SELRL|nr:hypothetical protein [Selenomonas ruminantium]BAL85190.1 hypothetical protein SELR_pSRC500160 [Selenomonas ruminantium subsp. lactilytica TAM6421]
MTWYKDTTSYFYMNRKVQRAKSANHYSAAEITKLFNSCTNDFQRDFLIDRLYFLDGSSRYPAKDRGIMTARQMLSDQYLAENYSTTLDNFK